MNSLIERLENLLQTLDGDDWEHPITCQEDLRKAIDLLKWHPIETVCKDDINDIVWLANKKSMRLGFWVNGKEHEHHGSVGGGFKDFETGRDLRFAPTHWKHKPAPPEGDDDENL